MRPVVLAPAPAAQPGAAPADMETVVHKVHLTYNWEPSRRLRFYQFDPMHHDVAIYSVH